MKINILNYIKGKYEVEDLLQKLQSDAKFAEEFLFEITNYISLYKESIKKTRSKDQDVRNRFKKIYYDENQVESTILGAAAFAPETNKNNEVKIDIETIIEFLSNDEE